MAKGKKLNKAHFDILDAYGEEAFAWANEMWCLIASNMCKDEDIDIELVSIAFAKIFYDFVHFSMDYTYDSLEWHLEEFYDKENTEEEWDMMWKYIDKIHTLLKNFYGENYKIYETLESKILILTEEGEEIYPYGYCTMSAFMFVEGGFMH
jgi:hypothetical protein